MTILINTGIAYIHKQIAKIENKLKANQYGIQYTVERTYTLIRNY